MVALPYKHIELRWLCGITLCCIIHVQFLYEFTEDSDYVLQCVPVRSLSFIFLLIHWVINSA